MENRDDILAVSWNRFEQSRRAQKGIYFRRFTSHRFGDGRIMQYGNLPYFATMLTEPGKGPFQLQRLIYRLLNKKFHHFLTEFGQHSRTEATAKPLHSGKADSMDDHRFAVQYLNVGLRQRLLDEFLTPFFVIVVAQHTDHGYAASLELLDQ